MPVVILSLCIPPLYVLARHGRLTEWRREKERKRERRSEGGDAEIAARRGRQYDVTQWKTGRKEEAAREGV